MKPFLRATLERVVRYGGRAAVVVSLGTPLAACGGAGAGGPGAQVQALHLLTATRAALTVSRSPSVRAAEPSISPSRSARSPGEFVVYRFTGAYRRNPVLLTERVVAREGSLAVVDYTVVEQLGRDRARGARRSPSKPSTRTEAMRVRLELASGLRDDVSSVHRLVDGAEVPERREAFAALVATTVANTDENLETIGRESTTQTVFGRSIPCERVSYRVRVGLREGKMTILRSEAFAWGDLGAEIVLDDGTLLYRAELLESGRDATAS